MKSEMQILYTCQKIAREAGHLVSKKRREGLAVSSKKTMRDIVTDADMESEKLIREQLHLLIPEIGISGEEGTAISGTMGMAYIDPIDGTIPFVNGFNWYGVSIGIWFDNQPAVGVIYFPEEKIMLSAQRSSGAWRNRTQLPPVKQTPKVADLVAGCDFTNSGDREREIDEIMKPLARNVRYPFVFGCVTHAARLITEGRLHAYVHPGVTPYDIAAAAIIVRGMGGVCTRLDGSDIDIFQPKNSIIMSCNQTVHWKMLSLYN